MRQLPAFPRRLGGLVLLGLLFSSPALAQQDLRALEAQAVRAAVSQVSPSVVRIETFGGLERVDGRVIGVGPTTGLVVSEQGHIISSAFNFIQRPTSILITLDDGRRAAAEIIARDHSRMLVLLKANFDEPLSPAVPAPMDSMQVGQWTIAVGRTFSPEEPNVSVGVMSALDRVWGKAIQTDAKISPNNYGGPLVDIHGRVLGVLVPLSPQAQQEVAGAEWYDSGIGFAVPLVDVLERLETLQAGENLHPGLLGISLEGSNEIVDEPVVAAVRVKSPGELAGAQAGDKIVSASGMPVSRVAQLKHVLGRMYAGDQLELQVEREGELLELTATLVAELLPYEHPFLGVLPERGMAFLPLPEDLPDDDSEPGLPIRHVFPSSPADQAGMQAGDRLIAWNGEPVSSQEEVERLLARHEPEDEVTVGWLRGEQRLEQSVVLATLPTEIPEQLPELAARQVEWPWDGERPATGKISLKVPEEPNDCFAWIPESYRPDQSSGVLVWLHPAGEYDFDQLVETWKDYCEAESLILLAPKSAHATGWQPTELGFLRRVMEQLFDQYVVDRRRVVLHGRQVGGAMSYLMAFTHRELVRGIAPVEAALPARLRVPDNDPLQRLAVFSAVPEKSRSQAPVEAGLEALRERKFPVHAVTQEEGAQGLDRAERELLVRWMDLLDRL